MIELGDLLTMGSGTLPSEAPRPPCVSGDAWSTEEVEAQLTPEEAARLRELRRACYVCGLVHYPWCKPPMKARKVPPREGACLRCTRVSSWM